MYNSWGRRAKNTLVTLENVTAKLRLREEDNIGAVIKHFHWCGRAPSGSG
jgi:hypothetical protein